MDLSNKMNSILYKDLEVSSSEEEMEESASMNEEGRLSPGAGAAGPNAEVNRGASFVVEGQQRNVEVEEGEIIFPDIRRGLLNLNRSVDRPGVGNVDLDEVCRQRNIFAPPRGYHPQQQNRHRFQQDRQVAGANEFTFTVRSPLVGPGRDQTFGRRQHYLGNSVSQDAQRARNEKLKKAVQVVTASHPETASSILDPAEEAPEGYPEFQDEPWQCISKLINKGFSMCTRIMKLVNHDLLNEEEETRLYRCLVSYNDIEGICEASNSLLAKHGAAVDLLRQLSNVFPNLGRFPEEVNEALLVKRTTFSTLLSKMMEKNGVECRFRFVTANTKVNNHTLYKSVLFMEANKYEAFSYLSERAAKSLSVKKAYEDLIKEDCPMIVIHVGVEQCTGNLSLYRGTESHMIHCFDFSEATFVGQKNDVTVTKVRQNGESSLPRREDCVPVCYIKPQNGPMI